MAEPRLLFREWCRFCDQVLSSLSEEALKEASIDHLAKHLYDHMEEEVEAGRMERIERDGRTLYREVAGS